MFELIGGYRAGFVAKQFQASRQPWGLSLGEEEIVWGDKVMLTRNGKRDGWHNKDRETSRRILGQWRNWITLRSGEGRGKKKRSTSSLSTGPDLHLVFGRKLRCPKRAA